MGSSYRLGRIGKGYIGTDTVKTSEGNQDIIPDSYIFYKFSFLNYDDCTVRINNGDPIYLKAEQGFDSDIRDASIHSFEIVESGVQYQFIGAY